MNKNNTNPLVAIIILNWNGATDTIDCVNSLKKLNYSNIKIIIVDNASVGNDIIQITEKWGRSIDLIKNPRNDGYAQGNNVGIKWAQKKYHPDYYWILNNDTVVDPNSLTEIIKYTSQHPEISIIGSFIRYWQSPLIYCLGGGKINLWTGIDLLWGAKLDFRQAFIPKHFSYISGCSLFFSRTLLKFVRGFDPDYFLYGEEADFCLRARRTAHLIGYCPSSIIYHKSAQSTGYHSPVYIYYFLRNKLIFMKKNADWWQWLIFIPVFIFYYCLGFLVKNWKKNKLSTIHIIWQSISDFARGRWSYQPIKNE